MNTILRSLLALSCALTDEQRYWLKRKGMTFKAADGTEFTGFGAIGRFVVNRARIRKLRIDELAVGKLSVIEELKAPPSNT